MVEVGGDSAPSTSVSSAHPAVCSSGHVHQSTILSGFYFSHQCCCSSCALQWTCSSVQLVEWILLHLVADCFVTLITHPRWEMSGILSDVHVRQLRNRFIGEYVATLLGDFKGGFYCQRERIL